MKKYHIQGSVAFGKTCICATLFALKKLLSALFSCMLYNRNSKFCHSISSAVLNPLSFLYGNRNGITAGRLLHDVHTVAQ